MVTSEECHQEALPPLLYQLLLLQDQLLFPDDMYTSLLNDSHQKEYFDSKCVYYGKECNDVFAHSWNCDQRLHQEMCNLVNVIHKYLQLLIVMYQYDIIYAIEKKRYSNYSWV